MKRLLEGLSAALLTATLVAVIQLGIYFHRVGPVIEQTLRNVSDTSLTLKQNSGLELQEAEKAAAGASDLFRHTDITLNGPKGHPGLIPQLTTVTIKAGAAVDHLDLAIQHLDTAISNLNALMLEGTATVAQLQSAVGTFNQSIKDLDAVITDPQIKIMLANLANASATMTADLEQLGKLLASGTATAEDVRMVADKYRQDYLKARNMAWALFKELLPLAGSAAQVVK